MNRKHLILRHINPQDPGLEIGPSHNPIAPKREGFNVQIIDHLSREALVDKYRAHGLNTDKIEPVDFIWKGESYPDLVGRHHCYRWIIASHVIEHTPDLIRFLNDCAMLLQEDGILSLAIPDKRRCFDYYRPITGLGKIIDAHLQRCQIHTPGTVAEYYLNVVSQGDAIAWDHPINAHPLQANHTFEEASSYWRTVLSEKIYLDLHSWCFVPHSFRLMIQDLYDLGLIQLQEVDFHPTEGCEFFMTLGRRRSGATKSRQELLEAMQAELREAV